MVNNRTFNNIILSVLEFYRTSIPQLDNKPGTVSRDLFVEGPATQISRLYEDLQRVKSAQSLRLSLGSDLDKLSSNFGPVRQQGTRSSGIALLTFSDIEADIPINRGDIVTANNGTSFQVTTSVTVTPTSANTFRATAQRHKSTLDFVGITDEFAVEVPVEASVTGTLGNVSRYALTSTNIPGVSSVTNANPFSGGTSAESDSEFRNRVLAIFSGANTGTETGFRNIVVSDPQVIDALVVGPGNTLMTRDGTVVNVAEDGTRSIISDGTGGKVDIYVFGTRLLEVLDSYIYRDNSNTGDPANIANDFVLGQLEGDGGKTVTQRRIENLQSGILPQQPVNNIVSISGSLSGGNFAERSVDDLGRVTGNYVLVRDDGEFGGSPFGFDRLRYIDDRIRGFSEDQTKGRFNGQDPLGFSDVTKISGIVQNISVVNENSVVNSKDRTSIQLAHYPVTAVSRIFNVTTGERYVITNQNPDGSGSINETGRIVISGNTLPSVSDILQVDYTWIFNYDANFDFDNRATSENPRNAIDSIDWGFSNAVRREESVVTVSGSQNIVTVTHPISSVISVNTFIGETGIVTLILDRLAVIVENAVTNVLGVVRDEDDADLFNTSRADGSFSGLTIFLPTDTVAEVGDEVSVRYNAVDIFTTDGVSGSFDATTITLSTSASVTAGTIVECNYIANIKTLLPGIILPNLPALRSGNGFQTAASSSLGTQPTTHIFSTPGVISKNLRKAPSRLSLTIAGSISPGVITLSGTTFSGIFDVVFPVGIAGLKQNLSGVIREFLNLPSNQSVPSNINVIRIIACDKVTTTNNFDVLSSDFTFDIKGYKIRDNSFSKDESLSNSSLLTTEFELPETPDNLDNIPSVGERLRVSFYIAKTDDTENVSFSKSGTLFTQKIFSLIDSVSISSGFTSGPSQVATLTIFNTNQPSQGSRYSATYDYIAPKVNERITIRYNQNQVITDATLALEDQRPITSDALIKAATPIFVDISMVIVVEKAFTDSSEVVRQNVADSVTQALNASTLGTTIDESDLIDVAYDIDGVDRVRVLRFNKEGLTGRVLSITAQENEVIQANTITISVEKR